jgi:hypothetical protein
MHDARQKRIARRVAILFRQRALDKCESKCPMGTTESCTCYRWAVSRASENGKSYPDNYAAKS